MSTSQEGAADAPRSMAESQTIQTTTPREGLVNTAVNFLQNNKVQRSTLVQKQQFLLSKGLTPAEVQLACERAGMFAPGDGGSSSANSHTVFNMRSHSHAQWALQSASATDRSGGWSRVRSAIQALAMIGGLSYAVYIIWQKCVEKFLFIRKRKKEDEIERKLDERIADVNRELSEIRQLLVNQQRDNSQTLFQELNSFRSELEAIKGLLLNRKQFASPRNPGPPTIPAWQLSSPDHHRELLPMTDDHDKTDDAGSGSGSSEAEVVTKNSDSSLEIM